MNTTRSVNTNTIAIFSPPFLFAGTAKHENPFLCTIVALTKLFHEDCRQPAAHRESIY
jgi:hypothetical protein